jgi:transcriptional regulator NrdR family protein
MSRPDTIKFRCPHCNDLNRSRCLDVKKLRTADQVLRYRRCLKCGEQFHTQELIIANYTKRREKWITSFKIVENELAKIKQGVYYL